MFRTSPETVPSTSEQSKEQTSHIYSNVFVCVEVKKYRKKHKIHYKRTNIDKMRIHQLFIIILLTLPVGCKSPALVTQAKDAPLQVEKLLVLPFMDMAKVYGVNENVRCPVCSNVIVTKEVTAGAADFLTDHLFSMLQNNTDFKLIPPGLAEGVRSSLLSDDKSAPLEYDLLIATGRALKADAVMAGYIFRFKERVGTQYAVKSPASVAFEIHLIQTADGRILWSGQFNETQRSLSEDLLKIGTFLKRKAKWITAREMAQAGLEETLRSMSGFKIRVKNPE